MPGREGSRNVRFGEYELDPGPGELRKNGRKLRLPAQAIQVLEVLLERPGELITRDQLNSRLWPNGTIVEFDHGLNSCIRRLRAALNDSAEQPRYIETLPKRGYRFIFPCEGDQGDRHKGNPKPVASGNQYRIVRKLGAGAMGVVYRATDTTLGRDVALKFPHNELLDSEASIGAFQREARAAAALNHPNICTVYGVGTQEGRPFIAMELLEGETLDVLIGRRELSIEEVLDIAVQVAAALDAAHGRAIVHRDIKPSNIFISSGNAVKVMDFGVARCLAEMHPDFTPATDGWAAKASAPAGTVRYMAPEQLRGGAPDPRSDLYSFGVLLYEMITRRAPFDGESVEAMRAAIGSAPPAISERRPGVPPQLTRIVGTCLEPDPALRWQSAQELLTRLKDVAEPGGPRNKPRAPATQRKLAWSALGIAACATVLAAGVLYRHNASTEALDSIAVLPIFNESRALETEYLADGITEAIINRLSDARGLKVISRATVFLFKGQVVDPQKVGRQLGVGAVAMGKLAQRGDSLAVQIDLVRVADGSELWGEHFQRSIGDIQALHGDIAREIAEKLRLRLAGDAIKRMTRRDTANSEAYQLYLKAMYLLEDSLRNESDAAWKRILYLQEAIAKDPGFARAYVELAASYGVIGEWRLWPAATAFQKQKQAARRALELDDDLGEAHREMAMSLWHLDWDWTAADREFKRAIKLNTNSAHLGYGRMLAMMGQTQEAIAEAQRAMEVDPLSQNTLTYVAFIHCMTGMPDQGLEEARRAAEGKPTPPIAFNLAGKGMYQDAIAEFEKLGSSVGTRGHLARLYIKTGRLDEARSILKELQGRDENEGIGAYEIAFLYANLGDTDRAFQWMDKAFRQRDPGLTFLKVDPAVDPLRSDPRFRELQRRVGLIP